MAGNPESRRGSAQHSARHRHPGPMMAAAMDTAGRHPWDDAAEGWSRHTDLVRHWLTDATAAMLDGAHIASGQRVLDVAAVCRRSDR